MTKEIIKSHSLSLIFIMAAFMAAYLDFSGGAVTASHAQSSSSAASDRGSRGKLTIDFKTRMDFIKRGRSYLESGDMQEALYCATYAISNNCDTYESYLLLSDIYGKLKQDRNQAYALSYVIKNAPNPRLAKQASIRLENINNKIKSDRIKRAAAAVSKSPDSYSKVLRLGDSFAHYSENEKAVVQYEHADSFSKTAKSPKYAQALLYLKNGDRAKAAEQVKRYFALMPDDTHFVYLLASCGFNVNEAKEMGYSGKGGFDVRKYNRTYAEYYFKDGYRKYHAEKDEDARTSLSYSLEYNATNPKVHRMLGEIYYKKGMFLEARKHLKIAYAYMHTDYEIGLLISRALVQLDRKKSPQYTKEARYLLKELLKSEPGSKACFDLLRKTGLTKSAIVADYGYIDPDAPEIYKRRKTVAAAGPDQKGEKRGIPVQSGQLNAPRTSIFDTPSTNIFQQQPNTPFFIQPNTQTQLK